jgi:hypothetical protein
LGAEDKKTVAREYLSKHQGLGIAQVDASAPRIRALQLLDNNLEPIIRHEPNAKECRVVEDQLKPTNIKRQILHVRKRIVYITNQRDKDSLMTQTTTHSRRACHAQPHTRY